MRKTAGRLDAFRKPIVKRIALIALLLVPLALWVVGEIRYASRIRPDGVRTIAQHLKRFGDPRSIHEVKRGAAVFYELQGFPGGHPPRLALPSDAPAYVYNGNGNLVDWCPDPGDTPQHRRKWPRVSGEPLDLDTFLTQFRR